NVGLAAPSNCSKCPLLTLKRAQPVLAPPPKVVRQHTPVLVLMNPPSGSPSSATLDDIAVQMPAAESAVPVPTSFPHLYVFVLLIAFPPQYATHSPEPKPPVMLRSVPPTIPQFP